MKNDLKEKTLSKIQEEKIKIRPKSYFIVLKIMTYILSAIIALAAILTVNLTLYLPQRTIRMIGKAGIAEYLTLLPWPLLVASGLLIGIFIHFYKNYEDGYKKHFGLAAIIIVLTIIISGGILAASNFNEKIESKPGVNKLYKWNEDNLVPQGPRRRLHKKMNLQIHNYE